MAQSKGTTLRPLAGKTALVTGGTDGIGFHTACGLAGLGARVIVTGRDPGRGAEAADRIQASADGGHALFVQAEHGTVGGNQLLAEQLAPTVERLDILINNVGRVFPTRQHSADGYEASLALCFVGPVALTEALRPLLTNDRGARVVNMSSSAYKMWHHDPLEDIESQRAYVGIQAHAHAKQLNLIWTFALAGRLVEHGVLVNAVNPGAAWTPGTAQLTPEAVPAWKHIWPAIRFFQRRRSATKAAEGPIWLAASSQAGDISGAYLEKPKPRRPKRAADADNQARVSDLAHQLLTRAPTARLPLDAGHDSARSPCDERTADEPHS